MDEKLETQQVYVTVDVKMRHPCPGCGFVRTVRGWRSRHDTVTYRPVFGNYGRIIARQEISRVAGELSELFVPLCTACKLRARAAQLEETARSYRARAEQILTRRRDRERRGQNAKS